MALTDKDFAEAAAFLRCDPAAIKAVCEVETPKGGFNPDGSPTTLFEGHWFYKFTGGAYAVSHPSICYPTWTREFYGKTWEQEKGRLELAKSLDLEAALQSASWGRFQIMGFNWNKTGHRSLYEFVNAMAESEEAQLMAFVNFVEFDHMDDELRNHDWSGFARLYNGPRFKDNQYDTKLAQAHAKYA
jgi:hypothetical protein